MANENRKDDKIDNGKIEIEEGYKLHTGKYNFGNPPLSVNEFTFPASATGWRTLISPQPLTISVNDTDTIRKLDELEIYVAKLRKEHNDLKQELANKDALTRNQSLVIEDLKAKQLELEKQERFRYLIGRVSNEAQAMLFKDEKFVDSFLKTTTCNTVVMAVDIRRSTELMLKARTPEKYSNFIKQLCNGMVDIIRKNFGVFDKFTGDGILAFFPEFFTGEDALYFAIKAADECHQCFKNLYQHSRDCFTSILADVGLGIGIDFGSANLVNETYAFTVIGIPVVYACRFSGADAGQTLLNQPAYEIGNDKYSRFLNHEEVEITVKHEGMTIAYKVSIKNMLYRPRLPDWLGTVEKQQTNVDAKK